MMYMEPKAIRFRQIAIGNVLISMAWLAWGLGAVASMPRGLSFYETWWLYPLFIGPSIVAAICSLFGFHRHAAISFLTASLVVGSGIWLFIAGPLLVLIQNFASP